MQCSPCHSRIFAQTKYGMLIAAMPSFSQSHHKGLLPTLWAGTGDLPQKQFGALNSCLVSNLGLVLSKAEGRVLQSI